MVAVGVGFFYVAKHSSSENQLINQIDPWKK